MKRTISILLALLMLLAPTLIGCEKEPTPTPDDQPTTDTTDPEPDPTPETPAEDEGPTKEELEAMKLQQDIDHYNYIIGTQAFAPGYQFTNKSPLMELAEQIDDWGSNMIKFYATDNNMIDEVLAEHDFDYIFMWYRSDPYFKDGYSEAEAKADYDAFYAYTKKLLTTYNDSGKQFYLGHWEGDWYYLDNYNTNQKEVSDVVTEGMIAWLNNRQKAVDDAKRDTPHENVYVWNYLELNRPIDALNDAYDRVVNRVLPFTDVDYVSYSAYDTMDTPASKVAEVIDLIYANLPEKDGVPGPRVFIGEVAQPAANQGFDDERHCEVNLNILAKYLKCEVKFVLYWQMFCNEKLEDGRSRGFWLINSDGEETALYDALSTLLYDGKQYVKAYAAEHDRVPDEDDYRLFLLSHELLAGR